MTSRKMSPKRVVEKMKPRSIPHRKVERQLDLELRKIEKRITPASE